MKKYERPEVEIIAVADIIATSGTFNPEELPDDEF